MDETNEERLARLEADRQAIEQALVSAATSWALSQARYVSRFMLEEARLTVINQASVTDQIADEVSTIRQEVKQVTEAMTEVFRQWTASLNVDIAQTAAQDPDKVFRSLTKDAHASFGAVFVSRGYDTGSGSGASNQKNATWLFYVPRTGTARTRNVPSDADANRTLSAVWSSCAETARAITSTRDQLQRSRAARLWGED
jgi:hypothetical protein